jgi:flagellar basal body-associated protein FliL
MDDSVFEQAMDGKKKSLRVYLINPSAGDNPWRTQSDYEQEQKEARERHAMFQEQHRLLQKSFRINIIIVLATVILALATCILVYITYQSLSNKQEKLTASSSNIVHEVKTTKK